MIAGVVIGVGNISRKLGRGTGKLAPASGDRKPAPQAGAVEIARWPASGAGGRPRGVSGSRGPWFVVAPVSLRIRHRLSVLL